MKLGKQLAADAAEHKRVLEINRRLRQDGVRDIRLQAIREGWSPDRAATAAYNHLMARQRQILAGLVPEKPSQQKPH